MKKGLIISTKMGKKSIRTKGSKHIQEGHKASKSTNVASKQMKWFQEQYLQKEIFQRQGSNKDGKKRTTPKIKNHAKQ